MLQQFVRRQSASLRQSALLLALGLMCPLGGSMRLEDMPPGQLQYRNRAGMARPSAVDAGSWCNACHATVDMITLLLRHDWSEYNIQMKIEIVCLKMKAATVRQGSGAGAKYPDAFVKACSELIYEFEYPMIEVLYEFKKAGKADLIPERICHDLSLACTTDEERELRASHGPLAPTLREQEERHRLHLLHIEATGAPIVGPTVVRGDSESEVTGLMLAPAEAATVGSRALLSMNAEEPPLDRQAARNGSAAAANIGEGYVRDDGARKAEL